MERRNFLKTMGAGALSLAVNHDLLAGSTEVTAKKLPSYGLISGIGGNWLRDNPREALKQIAEWGFTELEFGGSLGGMEKAELLKFLKSLGLKPVIGTVSMQNLTGDESSLKTVLNRSLDLGQKMVACYWPWTKDGQGNKIDDWKVVAENLNKGNAICKKEGLKLLYHNHDMEFYPVEGRIPFDVIMPLLDTSVGIELDLYWITKSGQSAVEYIKKYPGRYPVFHVKDMPCDVKCGIAPTDFSTLTDKDFAPVGHGCIDFAEIFRHNKLAGAKHFMIENDKPADPKECIELSGKYLQALRF